jgi:glycosyltransferase involved in cell wall biosynthesis
MISVLIPIYNGIEYLSESLQSVIEQTYTDWEVIIGINGHPPNSDVEKEAYRVKYNIVPITISPKIRIIHYSTKGKPATLNAMVKDCKYDLVALLDVDDKWLPTKLEKQSKYWDEYDVVGTTCQYFGDRNDSPNVPTGDISDFNFLTVNPVINCSAVLKKVYACWNEAEILEDYELWLRLRLGNKKFYNINEVLCHHRIHKDSAFNNFNSHYVYNLVRKYEILFGT